MMDGRHDEPTVAGEDAGGTTPSDEEESDGEFEFPFVSRHADAGHGAAPADGLFAGGRIQVFYPVFGRVILDDVAPEPEPLRAPLGCLFQLVKAQTSSVASTSSSYSSSSSALAAELDGTSPDSYCLWAPDVCLWALGSSSASSPSRPLLCRRPGGSRTRSLR